MFLSEINVWDVVKKQVKLKLKSYRGMYTSLMVLQVLAILFSLGGEGGSGGGSAFFNYDAKYFTGTLVLVFVFIWAFISAILITTKAYRYDDFSFVTNRMTSHLSNIIYLLFISFVGGVTALLASQTLKVVVWLLNNHANFITTSLSFGAFIEGFIASVLYIFLFAAVGYVSGMLIQWHKLFVVLLPGGFIGATVLQGLMSRNPSLVVDIGLFFGDESNLFMFIVKILFVAIGAFAIAILISNQKEVRE